MSMDLPPSGRVPAAASVGWRDKPELEGLEGSADQVGDHALDGQL